MLKYIAIEVVVDHIKVPTRLNINFQNLKLSNNLKFSLMNPEIFSPSIKISIYAISFI